jgi:hypothetical protein
VLRGTLRVLYGYSSTAGACRWLEGLCTLLQRILDAHAKRGAPVALTGSTAGEYYGVLECSKRAGPSRPCDSCARAPRVPVGYPLGAAHGAVRGAGTLDQQEATVERVSKEIGALADLVEANEAKGRMGQVRASTAPGYAQLMPARDYTGCCTHGVLTGMPWCPSMHVPAREWP